MSEKDKKRKEAAPAGSACGGDAGGERRARGGSGGGGDVHRHQVADGADGTAGQGAGGGQRQVPAAGGGVRQLPQADGTGEGAPVRRRQGRHREALLAVLDNLERGVQQFEEGDPHRQGMELICKQFMEVLAGLGVTEIPALGEAFRPGEAQRRDAHGGRERRGEHRGRGVPKGLALGDKVLRFAMVKVAN